MNLRYRGEICKGYIVTPVTSAIAPKLRLLIVTIELLVVNETDNIQRRSNIFDTITCSSTMTF
jgi:flagellar biosynthesis regulator FlaF